MNFPFRKKSKNIDFEAFKPNCEICIVFFNSKNVGTCLWSYLYCMYIIYYKQTTVKTNLGLWKWKKILIKQLKILVVLEKEMRTYYYHSFLNYIKPYIDWKVTQPSGFDRLYIREEKQSTCWVLRIFNSFSVAYRCAYFLFVAK